MMAIKLDATGDTRRLLARYERTFPKTARGAHNAVASRVQNRFRKVMRQGGGCDGVPKFAPVGALTAALHPAVNHPGGVLAEKQLIVKYKKADAWYIGWVDAHGKSPASALAQWASRFQSAVSYPWHPDHKRYLGIMAKRGAAAVSGLMGAEYRNPARPVVEPLSETVARDYPKLFLEAFNKRAVAAFRRGRALN